MTTAQSELVVDGVRTPLIAAGPAGASEAVVFVHGNPGSSEDWRQLVSQAGGFARAVAFDMPGFGRADKPREFEHTIAGHGAFLSAVFEQLRIERVHLVLHDFGATWGLAWAAANPGALASVVLVNGGVMIDYRWHYLARIWRTPLLGELFMATTTRVGFGLLFRHGNPRGLPREFVDRMYADLDRDTRRAILALYRATPEGALAEPRSVLRELDVPALVVWGKRDPYFPLVQAERQRETFPNAEVLVSEDSGHFPFADAPERTSEVILPFLRAVTTREPEPTPPKN